MAVSDTYAEVREGGIMGNVVMWRRVRVNAVILISTVLFYLDDITLSQRALQNLILSLLEPRPDHSSR